MRVWRVWTLAVAGLTVGCGGGGGDDNGVGPGDPVFTTLVVQPAQSTVLIGATQPLTAIARDQTGNTMSGLTVTYTSDNTATATVSNVGVITGVSAGQTTIRVAGTLGGVTKNATASVTVVSSAPQSESVAATANSTFEPASVTIARNGTVAWSFAIEHNVTFTSSNAPTNIGNTASGTVSRTFANAGTFNYNCTLHAGMNGSVVVVP